MVDHTHGVPGGGDPMDPERAEKAVADGIEQSIPSPSSIEEEAMLEAADIEELEARP